MGDKHVVRFEPVGIEIEVDEEQTILRAAVEQGIMLMHGCKEGSAPPASPSSSTVTTSSSTSTRPSRCPTTSMEEGYTLLCRAHVYEDVTIELLNYDEDMIRSGLPIQQAVAEVVGERRRSPPICGTWCSGWSSRPRSRSSPGSTSTSRSRAPTRPGRSRWRTPRAGRGGQLEFVIKVYPDGLFSHFLDTQLRSGDRLDISGPVRRVHPPRGARTTWSSSAAAPGWRRSCRCCGPWPSAGSAARPPTTTAPGDSRDLCFEEELRGLERLDAQLPLRALTVQERAEGDEWEGETGLITDVVEAARDRPQERPRLRLRAAADGRGGAAPARNSRRPREAHLLRQVHHHRGSRRRVRSNRGRQACCEPPRPRHRPELSM